MRFTDRKLQRRARGRSCSGREARLLRCDFGPVNRAPRARDRRATARFICWLGAPTLATPCHAMQDAKQAAKDWTREQVRQGWLTVWPVVLLGLGGTAAAVAQAGCLALSLNALLAGKPVPIAYLAGFAWAALLRVALAFFADQRAFEAGAEGRARLRADIVGAASGSGPGGAARPPLRRLGRPRGRSGGSDGRAFCALAAGGGAGIDGPGSGCGGGRLRGPRRGRDPAGLSVCWCRSARRWPASAPPRQAASSFSPWRGCSRGSSIGCAALPRSCSPAAQTMRQPPWRGPRTSCASARCACCAWYSCPRRCWMRRPRRR